MFISTITEQRLNPQLTRLDIENAHARASISLYGGQVLSYQPRHDDRERLFLSPAARLDGSKSIRGGVPVCWPWFGAHPDGAAVPSHGYIRTRPWRLVDHSDDDLHTRLLLEPLDCSGEGFDGTAQLQLEVLVGSTLTIHLHTHNTGDEPLRLGAALHSYFSVSDVRQCRLRGLAGPYSDKNLDWAMLETPEPYRFTGPVDRVHLHQAPEVIIEEEATRTTIGSAGHDSIVVWNPWAGCSQVFPDLGEADWPRMLCVETALTQGFLLAAGQRHTLTQTVG